MLQGSEPVPSGQLSRGVCQNTAKAAKEETGRLGYCNEAFKKSLQV